MTVGLRGGGWVGACFRRVCGSRSAPLNSQHPGQRGTDGALKPPSKRTPPFQFAPPRPGAVAASQRKLDETGLPSLAEGLASCCVCRSAADVAGALGVWKVWDGTSDPGAAFEARTAQRRGATLPRFWQQRPGQPPDSPRGSLLVGVPRSAAGTGRGSPAARGGSAGAASTARVSLGAGAPPEAVRRQPSAGERPANALAALMANARQQRRQGTVDDADVVVTQPPAAKERRRVPEGYTFPVPLHLPVTRIFRDAARSPER